MADFPKLVLPGEEVTEAVEQTANAANNIAQTVNAVTDGVAQAQAAMPQTAPDPLAQTAAQFATAPAPQAPALEFTQPAAAAQVEQVKVESVAEMQIPEVKFSPEEQKVIDAFAERIDITDSSLVMGYGAAAQSKITKFTDSALEKVRTVDLGATGDLMGQLMQELRGFTQEEKPSGFFGLFKRAQSQAELMKSRYSTVSANVEKISDSLTQHQIQLMKDIAMYDKLYAANLDYYKELSMYIEAGRKKLRATRETILPQLQARARESGLMEDAQRANDMANMCSRFEKKLFDLDLTRNICIQMAPQIRLLQNNDQQMAEKIQSTIANTIPLWKNQMVLALGLEHSRQAMEAQRAVTNMTNELLRKNADTLRMGSVETAKEAERGIVDIETLQYTNQSLINTLDEVLRIQTEGAQKRAAAEQELRSIEHQLKQKMLEMRG